MLPGGEAGRGQETLAWTHNLPEGTYAMSESKRYLSKVSNWCFREHREQV